MSAVGSKTKLKRCWRMPVYLCEDHNEVLPHIYRAIGSRRLPFSGNVLVHFDAHPDLLLPDMLGNDCYNKDVLFDATSIGDWILPAAYAGHLSAIVWYKMDWSSQLRDGRYELGVGRHKTTGKLRVTLAEDYFLSELLYAPSKDLDNISIVSLIVITFNVGSRSRGDDDSYKCAHAEALKLLAGTQHWILDIDLDFFSTANPFCDPFPKELTQLLRVLYKFENETVPDKQEAQTKHEIKLARLKDCWTKGQFESLRSVELESLLSEHSLTADRAHLCGMMSDLPDHVSTKEEIADNISQLQKWLMELPHMPIMVTIARSTDDGYTPSDQVDFIQKGVVDMLEQVYHNQLNVNQCYLK